MSDSGRAMGQCRHGKAREWCVECLRSEVERLRRHLNPECPGCELKPNLENDSAVVWCDECVCELKEEIKRWRTLHGADDPEDALRQHSATGKLLRENERLRAAAEALGEGERT